jgi:hypothetical protein
MVENNCELEKFEGKVGKQNKNVNLKQKSVL